MLFVLKKLTFCILYLQIDRIGAFVPKQKKKDRTGA